MPTSIGVFTLADIGRVWAEGEESSKLHAAGGGGMWLSFFEERNTMSLAFASGGGSPVVSPHRCDVLTGYRGAARRIR